MITIWPSGSHYCYQDKCGIFFWGANSHDAVWHLALVAVSFNKWPFIMPVFSGVNLNGYNFLIDLIIYFLNIIKIPMVFSYFKLIPFIWFFVFTGLLITLGKKLKDSFWYIFWILFFAYFGSSFAYIFTLYHQKTIWSSASLLAMQSGQNLTNIPFSLSLIFLLIIMILIKKDRPSLKTAFIFGILIFINFGLKFYGGVVSLFMVGVYFLFKRDLSLLIRSYLIIGIFVIGAMIIFFNPLNSLKAGSAFIFSPFATMHSMIEEPIYFYLKDMVNARYYLYENASLFTSPRLLFIEIFSSLIFLIFSTGLRIFGLFLIIWKIIKRKINLLDGLIILSMVLCYLFLILFIQRGMWWNIVQFYYFFLFLLNFFTAEFFYNLTKENKIISNTIIVLVVIILTLPGNLDILKNFAVFPSHTYVSDFELKALAILKQRPRGIVYISLFKKMDFKESSPIPLYLIDSSYVSAYTEKPIFFADFDQLDIMNIDYKSRLERIRAKDCSILNGIKYIYEIEDRKDELINKCISGQNIFKKIYENKKIKVYERKK